VNLHDLCEVILFWREVNWSETKGRKVSYGEVLGNKSIMYIRVTLYWGYLIVLWLFHLVCILYWGCFNLFCNVWVCVCVGVVMCVCVCFFFVICECAYVWGSWSVGVLVLCVHVFTVFLYCFVYAYLFLFVLV